MMTSELQTAIQITIIGMSAIFLLLLMTWGLAALLVRLTSNQEAASEPAPADDHASSAANRRLAAAAAVAAALAAAEAQGRPGGGQRLSEFPLPPTAVVSPWQTVTRSKILNRERHRRP